MFYKLPFILLYADVAKRKMFFSVEDFHFEEAESLSHKQFFVIFSRLDTSCTFSLV